MKNFNIILDCNQIKFKMSRFQQLQHMTRDGSFKRSELGIHFLQYAPLCQDEEEVYNYMEKHQYGIEFPEFWIAKYHYYFRVRKLKQAYEYLRKAAKITRKKRQGTQIIQEEEKKFKQYLEDAIQMETDDNCAFQEIDMRQRKQFREERFEIKKIGQLQVYVDVDCRIGNNIDALIVEYEHRCKQEKGYQISKFQSIQMKKPKSWIFQQKKVFPAVCDQNQQKQLNILKQNRYQSQSLMSSSEGDVQSMYENYGIELCTPKIKEMKLNSLVYSASLNTRNIVLSKKQYQSRSIYSIREVFRDDQHVEEFIESVASLQNARIEESETIEGVIREDLGDIIKQVQRQKSAQRRMSCRQDGGSVNLVNVGGNEQVHKTPSRKQDRQPTQKQIDSLNKMLQKYNSLSPCDINELFVLLDRQSEDQCSQTRPNTENQSSHSNATSNKIANHKK